MAEVIRGNINATLANATLANGIANSVSDSANQVGQSLQNIGNQIQQGPIPAYANELGTYIAQTSIKQLEESSASIRSSVYADKMNQATLEFSQLTKARSQMVTDEAGKPLFGSLVSDVGTLGKATLDKYLEGIDDPLVKEQLIHNFNSQVTNSQLGAMSTARNQQLDFSAATYDALKKTTVQQAEQDNVGAVGDYMGRLKEVLDSKVAAGEISADAAFNELSKTDEQVRMYHANSLIDSDPRTALGALTTDPKSFQLPAENIAALKKQAEIGVQRQDALIAAQQKALKDQYKDLLSQVDDMSVAGYDVPKELKDYLINSTKGTAAEAEVTKALTQNEIATQFASLSYEDRAKFKDTVNQNGANNPALYGITKMLDTIQKGIDTQLQKDPVSYAESQKMVPHMDPLDTSNNLAQQLATATQSAAIIEKQYGVQSTGLSDQNLARLKASYETGDAATKASIQSAIMSGAGNNANAIFKAMDTKGNTSMAFAGVLNQHGNSPAMNDIFAGQDVRSQQLAPLPPKNVINAAIAADPVLKSLPEGKYKNALIQGISDKYDYDAYIGGASGKDVNKDVLSKSISGTIKQVEYNGSKVITLNPSMTDNDLHDIFNGISPDNVHLLGPIEQSQLLPGETPDQMIKDSTLVDAGPGKVMLVPSAAHGSTRIIKQDGTPLIIDIDHLQKIQSKEGFSEVDKKPEFYEKLMRGFIVKDD